MKKYKNRAFSEIKKRMGDVLIIHYSSEGLNDKNESYSPRVTSIVVHNFNSNISHSFSIHLEAEINKVFKDNICNKYDNLEKAMLENFFNFAKDHCNHIWLHWNMRDITYGFELLEHRYRVLGAGDSEITKISDMNRFNLSDLILNKYGKNAVSHPRMPKLMELNGGIPKDFMSGDDETKAFKNKEYMRLHKSTLSKVGWFRDIFILLVENKIKTEHSNWKSKAEKFCESPFLKISSSVSSIHAIVVLAIAAVSYCVYFFR
jgi:hypothetical protein